MIPIPSSGFRFPVDNSGAVEENVHPDGGLLDKELTNRAHGDEPPYLAERDRDARATYSPEQVRSSFQGRWLRSWT
nr:hypothetical protein KPHV_46460 [Kitasatospora purpeofusca]